MQEIVLVTGATGTVGSEVVKQLASKEDTVIRVGLRSASGNTFESFKKIEKVQLDYQNPDTLGAALKGVDKLFLLTPFQSNMTELTSNLLDEAKRSKVRHIVKQSVMGADADPGIIPSRLHRQAEKIIEESGISFTFLRPNFFMQNFATFDGNLIKNQSVFYAPTNDAKVSFVDVRDIASVAVQALTNDSLHKGKAYNITGGEALSHEDVAQILSKVTSKKINYVNISTEDNRKGMKEMGMDEWTIDSMTELFEIARAGHASQISPAVEQVTGNRPISFRQFATDYVKAFK